VVGSAIGLFSFSAGSGCDLFGRDGFVAVLCDGFGRGLPRFGVVLGICLTS
jgi:hypothetical protein